jgi:hypothetical protein
MVVAAFTLTGCVGAGTHAEEAERAQRVAQITAQVRAMTPAERIAYINYSNQCIESANQLYIADSLRNQEMTVRVYNY